MRVWSVLLSICLKAQTTIKFLYREGPRHSVIKTICKKWLSILLLIVMALMDALLRPLTIYAYVSGTFEPLIKGGWASCP
jgi:hypothetical protein